MKLRPVKAWVSPNFRKMLKKAAVENDCSVIKFTEDIAKDKGFLENIKKKENERKERKFVFKL